MKAPLQKDLSQLA